MKRAVLGLLLWGLAATTWADYLVFEDGRHLKVREVHFRGEQVEVLLLPRGRMLIPARGVRYVTIDSDVEEAPKPVADDLQSPSWYAYADPRYVSMIAEAARLHGVDAQLVAAVIKVESDFRPHAVSPRGARGLMQLMPATGEHYGLKDPFDPSANVEAGVRHLKGLLERYDGQVHLALAAYNAGAEAVRRYHGIPPYRETRRYVDKVMALVDATPSGR
jgi:soluble lytic murein transglycosylase-like protein